MDPVIRCLTVILFLKAVNYVFCYHQIYQPRIACIANLFLKNEMLISTSKVEHKGKTKCGRNCSCRIGIGVIHFCVSHHIWYHPKIKLLRDYFQNVVLRMNATILEEVYMCLILHIPVRHLFMCMQECTLWMGFEMPLVCGASIRLGTLPENQNFLGKKSKDNLV